jgi:hypothetical protein
MGVSVRIFVKLVLKYISMACVGCQRGQEPILRVTSFFFERSTEGERIPHLIHLRVTNISNRKMNVEHTK